MQRRPKVLVIAESANPDWSSASLIGWSLSRALLEHVDAHVVTHVRNRDALQRAGWSEGREYTALDPGTVEHPIDRFGEMVRKVARLGWTWTTVLATFAYYYFEHLLWQRFGEAIRGGGFDIVHRITPVSPATPSPIARHCRKARVPFVWGPMNGGVPWPKEFRQALRREGEWLSYVRGAHRLLPGYADTRSAAAALITGSLSAWNEMKGHHERCVYVPENAIEPSRFNVTKPARSGGPLRVAFAGRLVPLKGVDMLIDAATPLVRSGEVVIDIIGDGPEMDFLRRQVAEARIADRVALHGWIDHLEVVKLLARSQVFAFPSIREFGGGVILEAMTLGLAPVVIASRITPPPNSRMLGKAKTCERASSLTTSKWSIQPWSATRSAIRASATCRRRKSISGPSPMMSMTTSPERTRGVAASMSMSTPLSGTRRPANATRRGPPDLAGFVTLKRLGSMAFSGT